MKYQKGMKARVTGMTKYHCFEIGTIVTSVGRDNETKPEYSLWKDETYSQWLLPEDLEVIEQPSAQEKLEELWKTAPEGATHYVVGSSQPWEKYVGDELWFWSELCGVWLRFGQGFTKEQRLVGTEYIEYHKPAVEPVEPEPTVEELFEAVAEAKRTLDEAFSRLADRMGGEK